MNKIFSGDCLFVMRHDIPDESVDLIYLDPPFFTGHKQKGKVMTSGKIHDVWAPGTMPISYEDSKQFWGTKTHKDAPGWMQHIAAEQHRPEFASYLNYMYKRLKECKRVLKDTGSIYLHCDYRANHYLKMVMDEIFDVKNFRNEIITRRGQSKNLLYQFNNIKTLNVSYDIMFWYSKNVKARFNPPMKDALDYQKRGRWQSMWNNADRPTMRYELLGCNIDAGQWKWSKERAYKAVENYEKFIAENDKTRESLDDYWIRSKKCLEFVRRTGKSRPQYWVTPRDEVICDNNWLDIKGYDYSEGYPTQKSTHLLHRVVKSSSNPGDTVLDPFCGCGTAIIAAEKLGRKWIGIDISKDACGVMKRRFEKDFDASPTIIRRQLNEVLQLRELELEKWVNEFYHATKPSPDRGVDGITRDGIPIQTKTGPVNYGVISQFLTDIKFHRNVPKPISTGIIFSGLGFDTSAISLAFEIKSKEDIDIKLIKPQDVLGDGSE